MSSEIHEGPLVAVTAAPAAAPKAPVLTGRQRRRQRRRRRRIGEEVMGWILVPLILLSGYWAVDRTLAAMGSSPTALYDQLRQAAQALEKMKR